jgi:type 1 glutamine amidotransferase
MSQTFNRRQMLLATGAAMLGTGALGRSALAGPKRAAKKVLFFTKSSGFQHSVIARNDSQLGLCERVLAELGKEHGFEIIPCKDGRVFDPDKIGQWDAFLFYTQGDISSPGSIANEGPAHPMSKDGKAALLDAIAGGKGFVGLHSASDTFHSHGSQVDPYIKMIGGEFISHGAQQVSNLVVTCEDFPGAKPFVAKSKLNDEWYSHKNFADDLHVIIAHDTKGMKGWQYDRPNCPETWARLHDKGRVFYTSMGHREDVVENPLFQGLVLGALGWITCQCEVDVTPNVKKVTPGYAEIPSEKR